MHASYSVIPTAHMEHAELIRSIVAGNSGQYAQLVERYQHMVYTVCLRVLRNAEDAEEAAQDSFVKAYRNLASYSGSSKFSTWLYSIAYRTAVSLLRKRRPTTFSLDELAPSAAAEESAPPADHAGPYLEHALKQLPSIDSLVLTLHYLDELKVEEIAAVTELGVSNVKVKLHRGRKRLAALLDQALNGEARNLLLNDA